ncbi:hypothetical protein Droror1_Dr00004981 [Drosera rotundifolia]
MEPAAAAGGNRAEAERLLGIAEKLLQNRDLAGAKEFAGLAQDNDPLLEGTDQILAVAEVLIAGDRKINNNTQLDYYAILGLDRRTSDLDLIKRSYRRLALLLHPDKNKFPNADSAFRLVSDAWGVLSDPGKKARFDGDDSGFFSRVELGTKGTRFQHQQTNKLPVRKSPRGMEPNVTSAGRRGPGRSGSFWTACPYCYILYEYPAVYEECCIRCENCHRAFHAAAVPSLPPRVPGKEAYYCCWGFFPIGFSSVDSGTAGKNGQRRNSGFPNWMPPMFSSPSQAGGMQRPQPPVVNVGIGAGSATASAPSNVVDGRLGREGMMSFGDGGVGVSPGVSQGVRMNPPPQPGSGQKKRGRPRKNPL